MRKPAQYLLRIDDLCPTVHARRWERIRQMIDEHKISPLLAIVPDNQDRELRRSAFAPGFWDQMRQMEAAGAAVALHGYRHLCTQRARGLIALHERSEFAGQPYEVQRDMIAAGLEILRGHGLNPRLWVAPRHSFDRSTLRALRKHGILYLSDGLARVPFRRSGVTWIPQQLWSPLAQSKGLWTICIHPNSTTESKAAELRAFIGEHSERFTTFERVAAEFDGHRLGALERMHERIAMARLRMRRKLVNTGLASRR
ncbi:MAG TPA: DUF2334 domain-containing protein [Terracidiphilus sp.]|nr:DUF2334 domain-containing protein [Terracidiphilus sp.]